MSEIVSAFKTERPCLTCGALFLPQRHTDRPWAVDEYCSITCRKKQPHYLGRNHADRVVRPAPAVLRQMVAAPSRAPRARPLAPSPRRKRASSATPFGAHLARLRAQRGWTQGALAERVGAHVNSVLGWESGRREPPAGTLATLADLFDVSMDYLWFGERKEQTS